jgi:hypothetical protein
MEIEMNVEDNPWETGLEKVENVYCPMKWIPEIEAEGYKLRFFDDQAFVERMGEEPFYLATVREVFDTAKDHVAQTRMFKKFDDAKKSTIMTIARELCRRAEGCCYLAEEIASGRYSLDVIQKAESEIRNARYTLQPFVLKDDEIEKDQDLLSSYLYILTIQYRKVVEAGEKVIEYRNKAEAEGSDESVVEKTELGKQTSDDTIPPHESQTRVVTLSPPGKKKKYNQEEGNS